jgi:hypothetical protein
MSERQKIIEGERWGTFVNPDTRIVYRLIPALTPFP